MESKLLIQTDYITIYESPMCILKLDNYELLVYYRKINDTWISCNETLMTTIGWPTNLTDQQVELILLGYKFKFGDYQIQFAYFESCFNFKTTMEEIWYEHYVDSLTKATIWMKPFWKQMKSFTYKMKPKWPRHFTTRDANRLRKGKFPEWIPSN